MKIIKQSWCYENAPNYKKMLEKIEKAARTCYQSEPKGEPEVFLKRLINTGHHSVFEHDNITLRIITDRGVTHELVRHRLAAYSQESTRYCNYAKKDMEFILPVWLEDKYTSAYTLWHIACEESEKSYGYLIAEGQSPQQARTVLNNSLKTEIVVTANIREWRHILSLRTSKAAHPQMKALMDEILFSFKDKYGVFFYDIWAKSN